MQLLRRFIALIEFMGFYLWEVVLSNLRVAYDVLTPTHHMKPEFIRVDVTGMTDTQLMAVANLITMTPGTLSVDVTEDQNELIVHAMYVNDALEEAAQLKQNYLGRIKNVW